MDKITEEVITNLIRRIEDLEEKIREKSSNKFIFKRGIATEAQVNYLKSLGGDNWEGMTKSEAGKEIDMRLKINAKNQTEEQTPKPKEEITPEAESIPLTKKEIKEIGEDNLI